MRGALRTSASSLTALARSEIGRAARQSRRRLEGRIVTSDVARGIRISSFRVTRSSRAALQHRPVLFDPKTFSVLRKRGCVVCLLKQGATKDGLRG